MFTANILPHFIVIFIYTFLTWYFWRTEWFDIKPASNSTKSRKVADFFLFIGIVLHGVILSTSIFTNERIHLGFAHAISATLWLTIIIYWLGGLFLNLKAIQPLVLPFGTVSILLLVFYPATSVIPHTELIIFQLHLLIALLAYGLSAVAAFHALLMAFIERRLHKGNLTASWQFPLLTMEKLLFQIIFVAFLLLSLTLITGIIFSEMLFNQPLLLTHKVIFAFLSWLIFLALLIGRKVYGWRGKLAIRGTLIGFFILLLAYAGTKFVLEVVLHRS